MILLESVYGSGRSNTPYTTLKIAVVAPIPRARGKEDDDGKAGIFSQHTKGEAQILKERFKKGKSAPVAINFLVARCRQV